MSAELAIARDDPRQADVSDLLREHLRFAAEVTPQGHVHALDWVGLTAPDVEFYSARRGEVLVGVGAIRWLDEAHGEIKSMHTARSARGTGVGDAIVRFLIDRARQRGCGRVSLETGTYPAFAPARALYEKLGFEVCATFADYTDNEFSTCMTLELHGEEGNGPGAG